MSEAWAKETAAQVPHAVAEAVTRFWDERGHGRAVSIDDVLGSSPGTPGYNEARATAIGIIASQASLISSNDESSADERATLATVVGSSVVRAMSDRGPLPQIEGYDLVACLGRGGMGAVFEGYQKSTGRRVAIKFMLDGLGGSDAARQRFEREVEVVARLQHPGIVSVIDSGVRRGKYFYVMEYVPGKPLDAAYPPGTRTPHEVIKLIAQVCDAVEYAHQRGVLHRDLKPSNIVIDNEGVPHLLDFGLAKVFDPADSDGGSHGAMGLTISGPGQLLGTLAYMASEQARGRHDETSVRTDVYALGAICYELTTGKLPCPMSGSVAETLHRIIETPPAAPSTLCRALTNDLEAVLLKSLEKNPERRYATVGEFAADLRRHLAGEPVMARRIGATGRAWRWVGRNRAISAVIAGAVVSLMVVSGVLVNRILSERDEALDSVKRLTTALLAADPERKGRATMLQLLDKVSKQLDESPPKNDRTEAEIREIIGVVYRKFGEYDTARSNQLKVLAIRERHARGRDHPDVAEALHNLAAGLWWDGNYVEAEPLYMRSLAMRQRLHPGNDAAVAMSLTHLAACRLRMGRDSEARILYQQALDMRRELYGDEHLEVAMSLNNLAKCSLDAEQFDHAETLFRQALDMARRLEGDDSSHTAAASQNLADCFIRRGEAAAFLGDMEAARLASEAAKEPCERALTIRTAMYPQGHHLVASAMGRVARSELLAGTTGSVDRAHELAVKAVSMARATRRPDHPEVGDALETLGLTQLERKDTEAATTLQSALAILEQVRPPAELRIARTRRELARALLMAGQPEEAERELANALQTIRRLRGDTEAETRQTARCLFDLYTARGDAQAAEAIRELAQPHQSNE